MVLVKLNRIVINRRYLLVEIPAQVRANHEQKYAKEATRFHVDVYSTAGESLPDQLLIMVAVTGASTSKGSVPTLDRCPYNFGKLIFRIARNSRHRSGFECFQSSHSVCVHKANQKYRSGVCL